MTRVFSVAAVLLLALVFSQGLHLPAAPPPASGASGQGALDVRQAALDASVMVVASGGSGSGVAFKNGRSVFVWTDAHVVEDNVAGLRVENLDSGQVTTRISFQDVYLVREVYENGRKVGQEMRLAKIIRYSARHDIALLSLYGSNWPPGSVQFAGSKEICRPGTPVFHVGSMHGLRGFNSLSEGVFSVAGRLRRGGEPQEVDDGLIYDQLSLTVLPGSSGGGVFRTSDGKCLGLVTEYLGPRQTPGVCLMTPARRLREFAKTYQCEWALDGKVAVPALDKIHPFCDPLPALSQSP